MTDAQAQNDGELSVSELSRALKRTVEQRFDHVRVRGELSGVKRAASGHLYMTMKDADAVLDVVCWRGQAGRLTFRPEDGLEVVAEGRLTTYPGRSKYQLVAERLTPAGAGALMEILEKRKRALAAEGLFAADRKRPLPFLPKVIGIVTSPTGAVIRDILHRLADRFPRHVLVWPVLVQGDGAAAQIAGAIQGFNDLPPGVPRPDVLIIARGGGSIEDLWAFNEEIVVRAAAASAIPLISAVGHETDTTLIDHASDRRAPTPTAAAEMAVPVRADLIATVADLDARLDHARRRRMQNWRDRLAGLIRGLRGPKEVLGLARQRLDEFSERLPRALTVAASQRRATLDRVTPSLSSRRLSLQIGQKRERVSLLGHRLHPALRRLQQRRADQLSGAGRLLTTLGPQAVLGRGYALLLNDQGSPIKSVGALDQQAKVEARLADGSRTLHRLPPKRVKKAKPPTPTGGQGSLL